MTIHVSHPFLEPDDERSPLRRVRGRLVQTVTAWTAWAEPPAEGSGPAGRASGLTVATTTVVDGDPDRVVAVLDPEADLVLAARASGRAAVTVLGWADRNLADVLAGLAPAPGGVFALPGWRPTSWGPVREGRSWLGCRVDETRELGHGLLLTCTVERVEHVPADADEQPPLLRHRGRYTTPRGGRDPGTGHPGP